METTILYCYCSQCNQKPRKLRTIKEHLSRDEQRLASLRSQGAGSTATAQYIQSCIEANTKIVPTPESNGRLLYYTNSLFFG
jgi:hypothetical protein